MAPYPPKLTYKKKKPPTRDGLPLTYIVIWRWSPTFVLKERYNHPFFFSQETQENVPNRFTLHSIAPAFGGIYRPSTFEENKGAGDINFGELEKQLLDRLKKIWPDLIRGQHSNFINYQWRNHGVQSEIDPLDYLKMATFIVDHYDIGLALYKQGIVPGGGTYYPSDISSSLQNRFGVAPSLMNYFEENLQFVYEIKMGFDVNLQPIDLIQIGDFGQAPPITPFSADKGKRSQGVGVVLRAIGELKRSTETSKKRKLHDLEGKLVKAPVVYSKESSKHRKLNDLEHKSLKIGHLTKGGGSKHGDVKEDSSVTEMSREMMLHIALKDATGSCSARSLVPSPPPLPTRPPAVNTSHVQESSKTIARTVGKTPKDADVIDNKGINIERARKESNTEDCTKRIFHFALENALKNAIEKALPRQRPGPLVTSPPAPTAAPSTAPSGCVGVPNTTPSIYAILPNPTPHTAAPATPQAHTSASTTPRLTRTAPHTAAPATPQAHTSASTTPRLTRMAPTPPAPAPATRQAHTSASTTPRLTRTAPHTAAPATTQAHTSASTTPRLTRTAPTPPAPAPAPVPATYVNLGAPIIYEKMETIAKRYMSF